MGGFWDDDLDAIFALHLLGLGPAGTEPACSRCDRPIERDQFETEEGYEKALALRLCCECVNN